MLKYIWLITVLLSFPVVSQMKFDNVWLLYAVQMDRDVTKGRIKVVVVTQCEVEGDLKEKSLEDIQLEWAYLPLDNQLAMQEYSLKLRERRVLECREKYLLGI